MSNHRMRENRDRDMGRGNRDDENIRRAHSIQEDGGDRNIQQGGGNRRDDRSMDMPGVQNRPRKKK